MSNEILYMPFDGDYDASRSETLGRFATALLGNVFTRDAEIMLSFISENDPPIYRHPWHKTPVQPPKIQVVSYPADSDEDGWGYIDYDDADSDEDGWGYIDYDDIPAEWRIEDVAELFQYGNIYFHPVPSA